MVDASTVALDLLDILVDTQRGSRNNRAVALKKAIADEN